MAYVINKSDGTALITLEDATVDNTTSLTMVGRNYIGYGEAQNENFLFLLENFANAGAPAKPIAGQLWFDTENDSLKIYDGANWIAVGFATISDTVPSDAPVGSFWFKSPYNTLYIWNGNDWVFIGPETAEGYATTRAKSRTVLATNGITYPIIEMNVNGVPIAIIASNEFTIDSTNSIDGYATLQAGITLKEGFVVKGNIEGNASSATRLENTRQINGIGFNGTNDITITSSTTQDHVPGDYLNGQRFDGSNEVTWSVDATASNNIGTVVARNSSGGFAAGLITADLSGNVTGNVTAASGTSRFDVVEANRFVGPTLSGNAFSATKLRTARNINGVAFDGQADITVTASATTLTGTQLATNVVNTSIETVGTLTSLDVTGRVTIGGALGIDGAASLSGMTAETELRIVAQDGSDTTSLRIISPIKSQSEGTGNNGAIVPTTNGDVDLGKSTAKFDNAYANTFTGDLVGNADTATLSTTSTNLAGGASGSIPYQSASDTTVLLPAGAANQVLASRGTGAAPAWVDDVFQSSQSIKLVTPRNINGVAFDGTADITIADSTKVSLAGDTMAGFLTLHANPTASFHAATKGYVDTEVSNAIAQIPTTLWAGATTLSNVQATYSGYPTGTKVAFWEERTYSRPANSNGGSVSISDRYRRVVEKQSNGSWINVG
jgi:hypothetical protein